MASKTAETDELARLLAELDAYRAKQQDLTTLARRELGAAAASIRRALTEGGHE